MNISQNQELTGCPVLQRVEPESLAVTAAITMEDSWSQLIGCMPPVNVFELLGLNLQELTDLAQGAGQPRYRGRQLWEAVYCQRITNLDQATALPLEFRRMLQEKGWSVGVPAIERKFVANDHTVRYLFRFSDGQSVETVWMPEGDDGERGDGTEAGEEEHRGWQRATICVSSQVGCTVNCQFCMTALLGAKRNLGAGEIVGQVLAVLNDQQVALEGERLNLVFMGQGEPFLNYDSFMKAVRLLVQGVGIAESRMTVSTAGIVPKIRDLGNEPVRPKLAISLNASNDEHPRPADAHQSEVEPGGAAGRRTRFSPAEPRAADFRICAAGRGQ